MDDSSKKLENVTSFRRKKANVPHIPGTKISFQNAQLLTSTGVSSLDSFLGGGLPIGTAILVEEDCFKTYSSLLLKYFLAEGIYNKHSVFLASGDVPPEKILQELPEATVDKKLHLSLSSEEQLKIAWRYQNQTSTTSTTSNYRFDLSKTINEEHLKNCHIVKWDPSKQVACESKLHSFTEQPFQNLLQEIQKEIDAGSFHTSCDTSERNILRIAISSIDSPMWHYGDYRSGENNVARFLYGLRVLLRSSFSVAMITVPRILSKNLKWFSRAKQMVDSVISLESLVGPAKDGNLMLKDFDGLLHILKLPVLNSCAYQVPSPDLAFKVKRKTFIVEKLHLPPDLSGPETSAQTESSSMSCCGDKKTNLLDF